MIFFNHISNSIEVKLITEYSNLQPKYYLTFTFELKSHFQQQEKINCVFISWGQHLKKILYVLKCNGQVKKSVTHNVVCKTGTRKKH